MGHIISTLAYWPKNKDNEPIFKSTEDAYFFANLVYDNEKEIKIIRKAHDLARLHFKALRDRDSQDLNKMGHLATKIQYARECLEEIDRIHNDKFTA